ncbi:MAG: hypothetical protein ACXAEN_19125 [Candidatus Thorarchaeota archaeon]|jgi:hypothetical protein
MAQANVREVVEGKQYQGEEEQIAYTVDISNWGSTPTSPSVKAYDIQDNYNDVSGTVLSGGPTIAGDVITTPVVQALTAGKEYRIEVKFTLAGNVVEAYFFIDGQR